MKTLMFQNIANPRRTTLAHLTNADELATPYPWYSAQLRAGHLIILPNGPDDLPPEAEAERDGGAFLEATRAHGRAQECRQQAAGAARGA